MNSYFIYLAEASIAMTMFSLVYRCLFSKLTFFQWNRWFLITSVLFSIILPLLALPSFLPELFYSRDMQVNFYRGLNVPIVVSGNTLAETATASNDTNWLMIFLPVLVWVVYLSGVVLKAWKLLKTLHSLHLIKKESLLLETGSFYQMYSQHFQPTFSFGKNIFLHANTNNLDKHERDQMILHEKTHIKQWHTCDIMLFEVAMIVFWFNPFLKYLSAEVKKVHEYLVDRHIIKENYNTGSYARLLLKLASSPPHFDLIHTFSDSQLFHRLQMLTKPKSNPMQKIRFFTIVPMLALIITVVVFVEGCKSENDDVSRSSGLARASLLDTKTIASISWEGNKKFTDKELTQVLGLKSGDRYDSLVMDKQLYSLEGKDIASRYMDDGHLFFRVEPSVATHGDKVDVKMKIYEGDKARIGKVIIKGIKKTDKKTVLNLISIQDGEGFNKSALLRAQSQLAKSGLFKSDSIRINPLVMGTLKGDDFVTVDMEFEVVEL